MRKFLYIIIALLTIGLCSCDNSSEQTTPSSVAQLSAFSFASNDSMPGLGAAVFTVEERLDTGLVWNKDSILYGTNLTLVVPQFSYAATPGAAWLTMPDTTCALTGYDTLDFSKGPIYLSIRSQDKANTKTYEIRPSVHQVDPDLYSWSQLTESMYGADTYASDELEQRVVELGTDFVLLSSNGFSLRADRSEDGEHWTKVDGDLAGLPAGTKVRQIVSSADMLFYAQDSSVYTSTDAVSWTAHKTAYRVITALLYWNQRIWILTEDTEGYELATWKDGVLTLSGLRPQGDFPVSDFASVAFRNTSLRERAMIIGGFAENGKVLRTLWNLEYSRHAADNGYRLQDFSSDSRASRNIAGASVISYDDRLLLFGGVDDQMNYLGRTILVSDNEGMSWLEADTTKNSLPEVYQARQKQTAIVRNNDIYLFGGQDTEKTYSDVYKGHLNSIDW